MKKTILLFLLLIPFILAGCSCDKTKEYSFKLVVLNEQEEIINEKVSVNENENFLEILKTKYGLVRDYLGKIYKIKNLEVAGNGLDQYVSENCVTINYDKIRQQYWTDLNDKQYIYEDEVTKATWYYDGTNWITFERLWAVAEKAKWAKARGLGGIMFWDYNTDYQNELMSALYYNFRGN